MSVAFEGRLVEYTPDEVKVKLHNLTTKYNREKKKIGPSGGSPSKGHLYSKIHSILGEHRIHNLHLYMEDSRPSDDNDISTDAIPASDELRSRSRSRSRYSSSQLDINDNPSAESTSPIATSSTSRPRAEKKKKGKNNECKSDPQMDEFIGDCKQWEERKFALEEEKVTLFKDFLEESKKFNEKFFKMFE
ncbi:uncharacterized protein LOC129941149 [Eupeodes corollae]|uniref:uncharacterized protein LOC129941149 n=1 Tax=Eupeodes corollae TaxID=290404 RepID=UPI002490E3A4|nr:uncharacterized protein LOC129941149 [Eupeodes corollae]